MMSTATLSLPINRTLQKISANMTSALKIKALKLLTATTYVQWCVFQAFIKSKEVMCYKNKILKNFLPVGKCMNSIMKN